MLPFVPRAVLQLPQAELMLPEILADCSMVAVAYSEHHSQEARDYRLLIWNTQDGTVADPLRGHTVDEYAVSPSGRWAAVGFRRETESKSRMCLLDLSTWEMKPIPIVTDSPKESCPRYKFLRHRPILVVEHLRDRSVPLAAWQPPTVGSHGS